MTTDVPGEIPHPRQTTSLIGHDGAEASLLAAARSGRLPHAWLLGGPPGIGKATLAYRFARYLLASSHERGEGAGLSVHADSRAVRHIAVGSHANLVVLERVMGEKGAPKTIPVEAVRKALAFFSSTAADGGHRVCIVDSLEDLNAHGANALLKTIEEPPAKATILLLSHAPHRALPTIRSRCRMLTLQPLAEHQVERILHGTIGVEPGTAARIAALANGSIGRAILLATPRRLGLIEDLDAALASLPDVSAARVLKVAERLADKQGEDFELGLDHVLAWAEAQVRAAIHVGSRRLAPLADACEKIVVDARTLEAFNLDRRAFAIGLFAVLSQAWRQGALPQPAR